MNLTSLSYKRYKYRLILSCLIILLDIKSFAQNRNISTLELQKKITEHQFSNQDSSKYYLDLLFKKSKKLPDTTNARLFNDYGIYYGINNQLDSSLYFLKKGCSLIKYKNSKYLGLGYKNIANVYKIKGDYNQSIIFLNKALNIFKKIKDKKNIASVYGDLSANYLYKSRYDLAISYSLKSIELLKLTGDKKFAAIQKIRLGNIYLEIGKVSEAKAQFIKAKNYFIQDKDEKNNYYRALINIGDCYLAEKKHTKAKSAYIKAKIGLNKIDDKYIENIAQGKLGALYILERENKKGEKLILNSYNYLKNNNFPEAFEMGNLLLDYYISSEKNDEAIKLIRELDKIIPKYKLNLHLEYLNYKAAIYKNINPSLYNKVLELIIKLQNDLFEINSKLKAIEIKEKYDKKILLEKNERLKSENNNVKLLYWILILFVIFISFLSFVNIKKNKIKLNAIEERNKFLSTEKELLEEKAIIENRNNQLKEEIIKSKEREITCINLELINLKNNINDAFLDLETDNNLKKFKRRVNQLLSNDSILENFKLKFTNIHPSFFDFIQKNYPNLSKKDIELLMFIKMNMSNKEIANLLAINYESVISKKYLVRKKMGISSENELFTLINSN